MPDQDYLLLLTGRTVAFDMLLRALYAKWAAETGDPQGFITHMYRIGPKFVKYRTVSSGKFVMSWMTPLGS
jgi:hypothetical protein